MTHSRPVSSSDSASLDDDLDKKPSTSFRWSYVVILIAVILVIAFVIWLANRGGTSAQPPAQTPPAGNAGTVTVPQGTSKGSFEFANTKVRGEYASPGVDFPTDLQTKERNSLAADLRRERAANADLARDIAAANAKAAEATAQRTEAAKLRKEVGQLQLNLAALSQDLANEKAAHAASVTNLRKEICDLNALLVKSETAKDCCESKVPKAHKAKAPKLAPMAVVPQAPKSAPATPPKVKQDPCLSVVK